MPFDIEIVPSALEELHAIHVFHRRQIAAGIDKRLTHEPAVETKHRKRLEHMDPTFEHEPPLWELRVGDFRIFYDVNEPRATVFVRAVRKKPPHAATEQIA